MNKSFDLFKCHIDFLTSNLFGIVGQFPNTHSLQPMAKLIMRRVSLAEGSHRGLAAKLPGPGRKQKNRRGQKDKQGTLATAQLNQFQWVPMVDQIPDSRYHFSIRRSRHVSHTGQKAIKQAEETPTGSCTVKLGTNGLV